MNTALLIAIVCLTLGTAFGSLLPPLVRYLKRRGKTTIIGYNPNTRKVTIEYQKVEGDFAKVGQADVPLDGEFSFIEGDRPCFIVDKANGLPAKPDKGSLIPLTGQRLREIRKGIKIKLIASANAADLEALAKYALMGIGIIGILLLGAVVMIFKVMKSTGAA